MTPQTENSTKPVAEKYAPQTKLAIAYFHLSVMFAGSEMNSASVRIEGQAAGSNCVDSIRPATLMPDGSARVIAEGEPALGLLLIKKCHDLHSGKRVQRQTFVPFANVKGCDYRGE